MKDTISHPKLSKVMQVLRPNAKPDFPHPDYICQQDFEGPPFLAKNYESNPVTQAEVDAVTADQIEAAEVAK